MKRRPDRVALVCCPPIPDVRASVAIGRKAENIRLFGALPRFAYGRVLVKRGVAAFDEFRQGVKDIRFLADPSTGELRIGCSDAMAAGPVLAVIEKLTRRYPRLVFHVVTGAAATLCNAVMGQADQSRIVADAAKARY